MKVCSIFLTVLATVSTVVSCAVYKEPSDSSRHRVSADLPSVLDPKFVAGPDLHVGPGLPSSAREDDPLADIRMDVEFLSSGLCEGRGFGTRGAVEAAWYIVYRMRTAGLDPRVQTVEAMGRLGRNVIAEIPGREEGYIILMSYYDGIGRSTDAFYPGADSNASGVAALLEIARRLSSDGRKTVVVAAIDGHSVSMSGAAALMEKYRSPALVVNLDIIGSSLAPVFKLRPDYLLCLGARLYSDTLFAVNNDGPALHLTFDYYGSTNFTNLFYRSISDQRVFLEKGIPCVMFTSGITFNTNRVQDTCTTLDYDVMGRRVDLIASWLDLMNR